MAAVEMLERGSKAVPARSRCEVCPFTGSCGPCRPGTSGRVFVVESIKELLKEKKLPVGTIYFSSPPRQGGGEPPKTNEIICFICKEKTSTCRHSNSNTSALKAA